MELSSAENVNNNNNNRFVHTNAFNERNEYLPPISASSSLSLYKFLYSSRGNSIYYKNMDRAPWEQLSTSLRNLNEALGLFGYDP